MQSAWERERREKGNALSVLLATWIKVHKQGEGQTARGDKPSPSSREDAGDSSSSSSSGEQSDAEESSIASDAGIQKDSADSDGEDIVEDFRLSSEESD